MFSVRFYEPHAKRFFLCFLLMFFLTAAANAQEVVPRFLLERFSHHTGNWQDSLVFAYKQSRYRTWFRAFGNWMETDDTNTFGNPKMQTLGFALGLEQQWGREFLSGISAGTNQFDVKVLQNNRQYNESIGGYFGSLYFRKIFHRCYFDVETGLGSSENSALVHHSRNSNPLFWFVNGEFGFHREHGLARLEPYLGVRYIQLDNKNDDGGKTSFLTGVRYSWKTKRLYAVVSPRLFAGLLYEAGNRELVHNAFFGEVPVVSYLPGIKMPDTRAFFGAGWTSSYGSALDLYFRYIAELASNYNAHTILLGMCWNF